MLPFYHPTTVFVIDDEPLFLKSFEYGYGDEFLCHMERSPESALQALASARRDSKGGSVVECAGRGLSDGLDGTGERLLTLRTSAVAERLQDTQRFSTVSVIIVDYVMPSLNGIEFCRQIKDLPAKKILLTGRAGDHTAVEAFNEGLIDHFLVKHDSEIHKKLPELIRQLQLKYFEEIGQPFSVLKNERSNTFLGQQAVIDEIQNLLSSHRACEYYAWFEPSGVAFADENGHVGFIAVADDDDARAQREIAEDSNAPDELISALSRDDVIAIFPTQSGCYDVSLKSTWKNYVHTATLIRTPTNGWRLKVVDGEKYAPNILKRPLSLMQYKNSINNPSP